MNTFLSCDWGTSNFRLRLVRMSDLSVLATVQHDNGISRIAKLWQEQNHHTDRKIFYTDFLNAQIAEMSRQTGITTEGIPVLLSGMASSSIGLAELPYKKLPFHTNGSDLVSEYFQNGQNPLLLVSGACTDDDVMRGEETKIIGIAASSGTTQEQLLLLPGTHSKHVLLRNNSVVSFRTFMTGEFFALLSGNSILSASVKENGTFDGGSFAEGVRRSREIPLLEHSFRVRTNQLLKGFSPEKNYHYLSGLLIGEELKGLGPERPVTLMGGALHAQLYALACETLGIRIAAMPDADEALIKGQQVILSAHAHLF